MWNVWSFNKWFQFLVGLISVSRVWFKIFWGKVVILRTCSTVFSYCHSHCYCMSLFSPAAREERCLPAQLLRQLLSVVFRALRAVVGSHVARGEYSLAELSWVLWDIIRIPDNLPGILDHLAVWKLIYDDVWRNSDATYSCLCHRMKPIHFGFFLFKPESYNSCTDLSKHPR